MLPIPQEYIGARCEIKSLSNDLYGIVRIIKIDHEALEFATAEGERMMLLQYRVPLKVFIYSSKLPELVMVGVTYLSTENFLRLEEVRTLADFERRGAFRVNTGVPGNLSRLMSEDEQQRFAERMEQATPEEAELMMNAAFTEVRVMDVSLTGVRLATPKPLVIGQRHVLEFTPLHDPMTFCLRVMRVIHLNDAPDQFGCTFFDFSERQMDRLCRDLFQLQRFEKNRRLNNPI